MSAQPQGPGWWQASDGRWYAPLPQARVHRVDPWKTRRGKVLTAIGISVAVVAGIFITARVQSPVTVVYKLEGSARTADITYTDSSGNIEQQTGVDVPLVSSIDKSEGLRVSQKRGTFVQFSAQNGGEAGSLTCIIEAAGKVVNRGFASGGSSIASCSAHVPWW